ncbi:MAG: glycosyltransferase [Patescibacteria group bacterium]
MKVAILSNLFGPNSRGGAEEAAKNQVADYLSKGHEVVVITLSPSNTFSIHNIAGSRTYFLPHKNIFNYIDIGKQEAIRRFFWHIIDTFNIFLARDIKAILKVEKPDLIISHNLKGLSLLTPRAVAQLGTPHHHIVHDVALYTPSGLIVFGKENIFEHKGFLTEIYRIFTKKFFSYPEKIFFPSAWLLNFYRKNGFFINQEKKYEPNLLPIEKEGGKSGQRRGFLYVGQLEKHKGIMLLLDVFEKICPPLLLRAEQGALGQNDRITLNIVGDGRLMPEIKKRAELNPNIIIHGRIPREDIAPFYKSAAVTVFPSIVYENAPMVILESLSYGTPVVVSRLGGAPEQIKEGKNGYTFTPNDSDDLYKKLINTLKP